MIEVRGGGPVTSTRASTMNVTVATQERGSEIESTTRGAYVQALLNTDIVAARRVAEDALAGGMTPQRLYLGVFAPALHEIGALWERGRATIAQEHLATATTQALMARLWPGTAPAPQRAPCAITTATEGDWHVLGARFLADFLEAEGWTVVDLGAATPTTELVALVARMRPALVCLSTTMPGNLPAARAAVAALKRLDTPPLVAVGGHAYTTSAAPLALGAAPDLYASDAAEFLAQLRARLTGAPPSP